MGYGIVPDIDSEDVVCQLPCEHEDCAANRKWETWKCRICGKGFEAGQNFYYEGDSAVHAGCAYDEQV